MQLHERLSTWFPVIAHWVGMAGILWEIVVLKAVWHEEPNSTVLLICGAMMTTALLGRSEQSQNREIAALEEERASMLREVSAIAHDGDKGSRGTKE